MLCELARTDNHRFRALKPDDDEPKALGALTRAREDLVHTRVTLTHQLRAELSRFWPGPIGPFTNLTSPISLAFVERLPNPGQCARGDVLTRRYRPERIAFGAVSVLQAGRLEDCVSGLGPVSLAAAVIPM